MSVINKVVMAALNPLLWSFDRGCEHHGAVQEDVCRQLLEAGRDKAFGREHGFDRVRGYAE